LDACQQRQQAIVNDTLKRLGDLERERAQDSEQLSALDDRVSVLPDRLSGLENRLNGLPVHLRALEDRLNGLIEEFSTSRGRIDAYGKQLQGLRNAHEGLRDELYQKLTAAEQSRALVEEDERLHRAAFDVRVGQIEERLADVGRGIEAEGREVRRQIHNERTRLVQQEFRLNLLLREVRKDSHGEGLADAAQTIAEDIGHANDALFVEHARAFRGERAEIKSRLAVYVPYVQQAFAATTRAPALDLGCGRGEWLELLRETEIPASGIDWNHELIEGCRERGFHVSQGGIPRILSTIPDESLSIVTAFHVLEHIAFSDLLEVIDHAVRMLKPGGVAIFETPNPKNSFVSSNNFYLDPTHRHPIPSELLAFVVEARGLCDPKVMPLSPYPDHFHLSGSECPAVQFINDHFYGPQDYGIVAFKAG
jgi:O-antigen chain-terminating methyltransferase